MRSSATRVLLVGLAAVAPAAAQQSRTAEPVAVNVPGTLRCESDKGRPRNCQADVRGGARLTRQLSRSQSVEGETRGVRENEIWVKGGCRADFALGEGGPPGPRYIKCESGSGGRRHCPTDTLGGVTMIRQLSKSQCIQHTTWGYDRKSVWVSQGCRAEFQIGAGHVPTVSAELGPQQVRCESDRGRERRCEIGVWKGAELTKQLSKSPCVQGHSWGWDQRGVWVSRGCRAEFTVW